MGPKYELYEPKTPRRRGETVLRYRVRALRDIPENGVKAGDLGGWVENEKNLDQTGSSWIFEDTEVFEGARVGGNAIIQGKGAFANGNAKIIDSAVVTGSAISDNATVMDSAMVVNSVVEDDSVVSGSAKVLSGSCVSNSASVRGHAIVTRNAEISGTARIMGDAVVYGPARIGGSAIVSKLGDYAVYTAVWAYGVHFTYTKSDKMWRSKGFSGTGIQLIDEAYKTGGINGRCTEAIVGAQDIIDREMDRRDTADWKKDKQ